MYKDYLPLDARIIVNYESKNKVRFSYPEGRKHNKKKLWWETWLQLVILTIETILYPIRNIYFFSTLMIPLIVLLILTAPKETTIKIIETTTRTQIINELISVVIIFVIFFVLVLMIPTLVNIQMHKRKETSKWIPITGYWIAKLRDNITYREIKAKNIKQRKFMIPVFENTYLKYDTTKDVSKQLKKVEILEIPLKWKNKKGKDPKDRVWRTMFYFKKNPKNGELKIEFS